ncbi:enamine deaminase RidA (YjgF/YER057c/UK114 family) [Amycolatopsis echigonensis]|uniref:Enamine deaminase RidA (YjgF/YER057c/UK114 family) n=1 Tax=Amycolatopsis echigonensis TaxID=2576905 RepID=A0A2N3W8N2_9PSEU|nr:RidA family protein [Amycolatopsis niigatensis]PKV90220.1 enamine deaminase RidA (YjgF/YER057c/UK114 family) [Amycolatopsis niigatensis]
MTIERQNPPGLHPTPGYHHVTFVDARRSVHLAGQCPLGLDGEVVPGDVLAQVDQVVANTQVALAHAGATPEDVVRTVIYVATSGQPTLSAVWQRFTESSLAAAFTTASTLVGVTCLGFSGQLVELDVTAALA